MAVVSNQIISSSNLFIENVSEVIMEQDGLDRNWQHKRDGRAGLASCEFCECQRVNKDKPPAIIYHVTLLTVRCVGRRKHKKGRAGQSRAGQGRAGQGRAGQGRHSAEAAVDKERWPSAPAG